MLTISGIKEMQIKSNYDSTSLLLEWLSSRTQTTNVGEDAGEKKPSYTIWKTVWRLLKKVKIELPYDPPIPHLGIYPKDCKVTIKGPAHPCLLQHYSQ
jgi:hypothetical protein